MNDTKFVKAYCSKTRQYFGLEIKKFGSVWKVVNMIKLSDKDAKFISSEIEQPSFETNSNLIPCSKCGSRKVGGCDCAKKKYQCAPNMKYQFDCIYCNELSIDYTLPSRSDVSGYEGGKITLSQGQEVKIRYSDDRPLSQIYVGVGWDPAKQGKSIDVDSSVIVMNNQGSDHDLVFFANKTHPSGCVVHHGDNLTGADIPNQDDENISVYLNKVPSNRDRLVFVLNIYNCLERRQTFGEINNLYIRLYDPDSKKTLIEYRVEGNFRNDTALVIGMAYKKNGAWVFKAIGKGTMATDVHQLANECHIICR